MKLSKLFPLIGVILFLLVLMNINLSQLLDSLLGADVYYLFLAVTMLIPIIIVKAVKWKFLINSYNVQFPIRNLIKPWLIPSFDFSRTRMTSIQDKPFIFIDFKHHIIW